MMAMRGRSAPNRPTDVGVGQDNTVMLASAQRLWKFNGTGFNPVSPANNLIQVSLGNENLVFARDTNNNVYSFDPASGALNQDTDVSAVIHIATANDGSLWMTALTVCWLSAPEAGSKL